MKRLTVALAAATLLAVILVGVPWLLLHWGSTAGLSWSVLTGGWFRPDDGTLTLALLTLVAWGAWAVLAWSVVAELAAQLSRDRIRLRLPGTSWLTPMVSFLVAAALAPVMTAHAAPPVVPIVSAVPGPVPEGTTPHRLPEPSVPDDRSALAARWNQYEVRPGDELWDIAARELGGGERWREIVAANPGLDPHAELVAGEILLLPASITVEEGDTLWDLAEEHLGDPARWPELHEANRDLVDDPDEIDIGWRLTLPGEGAQQAPDQPAPTPPEGAAPEPPEVPPPSPSPPQAPPAHREPEAPDAIRSAPAETPEAAPSAAVEVLGPVGALLAAGVATALIGRRRLGLTQRTVGRRIPTPPEELSRHWAALGLLGQGASPPEQALSPTHVLLGWRGDLAEVWLELEPGALWLAGGEEEVSGMTAALLTSLLCAGWSRETEIVLVAAKESWAPAVDDPRLTALPDIDVALVHLEDLVQRRLTALAGEPVTQARRDPDRAPGFAPTVYLFCRSLTPAEHARVSSLLARGCAGVSVVAPVGTDAVTGRHLTLLSAERARLDDGVELSPQLLRAPARRALVALFSTTGDAGSEPAPWWREEPITQLRSSPVSEELRMPPTPSSPTLLLLGEAQLVACDGETPQRSVGRCLEACAWLLTHPGSTPTQMREGLMIAEGTRRSVVSRLRGWLGRSAAGEHLPDAYSGRVQLASSVSSDWEQFQALVAGGVNRATEASLTEALALVRGAPLGGFEFQWLWAEPLRCDMVATIVDAAVVLSERCLARGDLDGAEWALGQGALASPTSEALAARRILLRASQGDRAAVDQEVLALTRAARAEGRDLTDVTVRIIQRALSQCLTASR